MYATNAVICKVKLKTIAVIEYIAKVLTAGISDRAPIPKQQLSVIAVNKMDGPILPMAVDIASSIHTIFVLSKRLWACTKIKILSIPTANTKNGIT